MLSKKHKMFGQALTVAATAAILHTVPAVAQTTNECSTYSVQACATGAIEYYGYTSLKECRLTEYAKCRAGEPPFENIAYYPGTPANPGQKSVAAEHQPFNEQI
jgi:hypothetical protein